MEVRASAKCEWLGLESRIYNQDCALVLCSGTGLGSCDKVLALRRLGASPA